MTHVTLRHQRVFDAKRFFEILNSPKFIYWSSKPKTIQDEKNFIKQNFRKHRDNFEHNFAILADGELVGGCGIKIDQHRKYIGEIGYFVDEAHWGKGIATQAVKLLEKIGFDDLGLVRIEIWMDPLNKASEKVAIKSGFSKEGLMRKAQQMDEAFHDCLLYAKVK